MKKIKFSFALLVAVLAVGFAVVSNANAFNGKLIEGCFRADDLVIQTISPSSPSDFFSPVYNSTLCSDVKTQHAAGLIFLSQATTGITQEFDCEPEPQDFCCVEVIELPVAEYNTTYANVPLVNLGDGNKKYQITEVLCRP